LDEWRLTGRRATFWWRDDDAQRAGPRLERLLQLSTSYRVPLGLAVIPALLRRDLVAPVASAVHVVPMQHGYAHTNHAPRGIGGGAWDLGLHRPVQEVLDELHLGYDIMRDAFDEAFCPWSPRRGIGLLSSFSQAS